MQGITAPSADHASTKFVLITGAAGVVGRAIVDQLASLDAHGRPRLSIVEVGKRRKSGHPQVQVLDGSDADYRMGLSRTGYGELARNLRSVVHIASDSAVAGGEDNNVRVANEALDICERAGAHFYYVSTAFVPEHVSVATAGLNSPGPAERFLHERIRSGRVPITVVRTSLVIGDSGTGRIGDFPALYQVIDAIRQGFLSSDRLDYRSLLDFVPCDTVADVICRLVENRVGDREVWLTAGEQALSIEQVMQVVKMHAKESGEEPGDPIYGASSAPPAGIPAPARERALSALVDIYSTRLAHLEPLESSLGDRFQNSLSELGSLGVAELPDPRQALLASLRYWTTRTNQQVQHAAVA